MKRSLGPPPDVKSSGFCEIGPMPACFSEQGGSRKTRQRCSAYDMKHLIAMLEAFPPIGDECIMSGFMNDAPKVVLRSAREPRGMHKQQDHLLWVLDSKTVADFREKVQVLATASHPGHQYLEYRTADEITVVVSCNEWPDRDFTL
jgi:hypothetical protein